MKGGELGVLGNDARAIVYQPKNCVFLLQIRRVNIPVVKLNVIKNKKSAVVVFTEKSP